MQIICISEHALMVYFTIVYTSYYAVLNDLNKKGHVGAHKAECITLWQHS